MIQEHGGNIYRYCNILDMSANINPLGIPDKVREAIISSSDMWNIYPDPFCTALCQKIAEKENTSPEMIVCGNGADDIIYRLVHAFKPQNALLCAPSFGEYRKALNECDCSVQFYHLNEEDDFSVTEGFLNIINNDIDMVFLCSPNNPTGQLISSDILEKAAEKCADNNIILVCDQCFAGFTESKYKWKKNNTCIILNAFTKIYAMAGLRLGYAVCGSADIAEKIRKSGQYWSVSVPAQAGGIAALDENDYINKTIALISSERIYLRQELKKASIKVYPSDANYLLFKWKSGLDDMLLKEGILIRNCADYYGLSEGFYRIAVRTHKENQLFIETLRRCLNG